MDSSSAPQTARRRLDPSAEKPSGPSTLNKVDIAHLSNRMRKKYGSVQRRKVTYILHVIPSTNSSLGDGAPSSTTRSFATQPPTSHAQASLLAEPTLSGNDKPRDPICVCPKQHTEPTGTLDDALEALQELSKPYKSFF